MPFYLFHWDEEIIAHFAAHGISPDEFEEVVNGTYNIIESNSSGRPLIFGQTSSGKDIACIFDWIEEGLFILPVTGYEI